MMMTTNVVNPLWSETDSIHRIMYGKSCCGSVSWGSTKWLGLATSITLLVGKHFDAKIIDAIACGVVVSGLCAMNDVSAIVCFMRLTCYGPVQWLEYILGNLIPHCWRLAVTRLDYLFLNLLWCMIKWYGITSCMVIGSLGDTSIRSEFNMDRKTTSTK